MMQTIRIFLVPPLATLALVAMSLMGLMNYLTQQSLQTTYVVASLKQSHVCALCHQRTFAGVPFHLAALH